MTQKSSGLIPVEILQAVQRNERLSTEGKHAAERIDALTREIQVAFETSWTLKNLSASFLPDSCAPP